MSTTSPFEAQEVTPGYAVAVWNDFLILQWRQPITQSSLQGFERFGQRVLRRESADRARDLLVLIDGRSGMPNAAVREDMAAGLKRNNEHTRSIGVVFQGDGLQATVIRSIAGALALMARTKGPVRVFGTVGDAAQWQSQSHGKPELAKQLEAAAELLQRL